MRLISASAVLTLALSPFGCTDTSTGTPADSGLDAPRDTLDERPTLPPYVDPYACPSARTEQPALDDPLDAAEARAGTIRNEAELIGGEGAAGRVGHLKIYNSRVRFVVQGRVGTTGSSRAIGYSLYGGNVIDADRARPRGAQGQDVFRETFPAFAFRVSTVDEVAVACDGSNGRPAAIRVVGVDAPSRILGILDNLSREQGVRMVTHYVLRPDSDVLEIITEAQSLDGWSISNSAAGDFLGFGSALSLFNGETGFGNIARASMPLTWLAAVSDPGEGDRHVSYAIAPSEGPMSVPVVDASGTVGLYNAVNAAKGAPARFTRYLSVGDGDVASAVEPILRARHEPFGVVTGRTTSNALVYAYRDAYTVGANARSIARAQMDGSYRMALPPGTYAITAVDEGVTRAAPVMVTVTADGMATANPTTGSSGTIALDLGVLDAMGARVRAPVKVSLRGVDVEAPDDAMGELEGERESFGLHRAIFSLTGQERYAVKPGRYRATVSRGDEYDVATAEVTVAAGGEATLRADVRRVVDTAGMISVDLHQHTVGSIDSPRALCGRVLENVAEGLEFAATTDHDNVTDFAPCIRSQNLGAWFNAMRGNEISVVGLGHFNAYPLVVDPADPFALIGAQYWAGLDAQQLFDKVRREAGGPLLHVSHPRSNGFKGYFTSINLDPVNLTGRVALARNWEAMEVNESFGTPEQYTAASDATLSALARRDASAIPTLRDFFSFISRGDHVCALGNSDTHGRNNGSGWPHNLVMVGEDRPDQVTPAAITTAIRAQRVLVSNGIVVRIRSGGAVHMGAGDVVRASGGAVDLELDVQAAPWVDVRSLVLFENGRPLALTSDGRGGLDASNTVGAAGWGIALDATSPGRSGVTRLRATVHLRPTRDSHYLALARGGSLAPVGAGDAFGYTNPVYVDVDGNGWQPAM